MFDKMAQRADHDARVRDRLTQLIARASEPADELPADQKWIDVSSSGPVQARPKGLPGAAWWRRGRPGRLVERWLPGEMTVAARRRLPVVLIIGVVLGAAVAVGVVLSSGGARELPPELPAAAASPVPQTQPADGGAIVVSVVGRVAHPGLVSLPDGSRVADALRAAGGPLPGVDLVWLNIARRLADGEQIYVGVAPPPDSPAPAGSDRPGKLDLNSATAAELDTLPGVGTVTAQRVVNWRTRHGRFTSVDQLREVDGIGPTRFAQLKDLVMVR